MIRVLLMANDSLLASGIASTLTDEIDLDVVRLSRQTLGKGDRYSVVILVDEGDAEDESFRIMDLLRDEVTLLVIIVSLKDRNIHVFESYQLNNPSLERVIELVRDFGKTNLKKKAEVVFPQRTNGHNKHIVI